MSKVTTPYRSRIFDASGANALAVSSASSTFAGANNNSNSTTKINTISTHFNDSYPIGEVDINEPLELASKYIDASLLRDKITPILDDSSFHGKAVNYNYSHEPDGLGPFQPFERTEIISIPSEILSQFNRVETNTKMGIFPEISRSWVVIDNRLILWNITKSSEFQTFDEIAHTILKVELVKPKENVFADAINFLLLISTPFDIHILAVSYKDNQLDLYSTGMVVPTHGLIVDQFVIHPKTGQIFFTGAGDGLNIWELQYSNSKDWFDKKCNKRCLTRSTVSSIIPGSSIINSISNYFGEDASSEIIVQLLVDSSRGILYTLSDHSIIRAYKITDSNSLGDPFVVKPSHISTYAKTSSAKASPLLSNKYLKIVSLNVVTGYENDDLFLVGLTIGGCRLYLNGSFSKQYVSALRLESVKFPPTKITDDELVQEQNKFKEQEALKDIHRLDSNGIGKVTRNELPTILAYQKKSSVLVETQASSRIISPGIFFDVVQKADSSDHKLFVSVPDYGVLKYHNKYSENATFLESFGKVHHIVPLSPKFNAADRPQGYANAFASQYSKGDFEVAVLTSSSLQIYRYRTPDSIFESLVDDFTPFVSRYGHLEAASTALYVTCKYNIPKIIRSNAFSFFTAGIPNVVEFKPRYKKSITTNKSLISLATANLNKSADQLSFSNVVLSARFYGIVTLVGRLLRNLWSEKVFQINNDVKFNVKTGALIKESIFENEFLDDINIEQNDIEYYLSSISVLNELFETYGNSIACFIPSSFQPNSDKFEDFANQAENIANNSVFRLIVSIKEALSFLLVLIRESEPETKLKVILKNLSLDVQQQLSKVLFKDIFSPNENSKNLIKEILSSIINKSMSRGESIEYIAKGLQESCGTFCSTNDVIGFRAMEHFRKAKELGNISSTEDHEIHKDFEGITYHLDRAIELFEAIDNDINFDRLKEAINIMISLNEFPKAIKFALKFSITVDPSNQALQYVLDGKLHNDERLKSYAKRHEIFELIFQLLVEVDKLSIENTLNASQIHEYTDEDLQKQSFEINKIHEESYGAVLRFDDKLFHFELYDWFISQDVSDKLLEIETPYILPYLEAKAQESLPISDLLWIYHSKQNNYYQAALISYSLALSDFKISLTQRNEYLSRAIGFCNCNISIPTGHQRQRVIELTNSIEEIFEVSNVQYDLILEISNDSKLEESKKSELTEQLNDKILTVNELFNDFAQVLRYNEISLEIFKISQFRNSEEILSRYLEIFEELKDKNSIKSKIIRIGKKLSAPNFSNSSLEYIFPLGELIPILINQTQDGDIQWEKGELVRLFLEIGGSITYDKLFYILKDLAELKDFHYEFYITELIELIKIWYKEDLKLREIFDINELSNIGSGSDKSTALKVAHRYIINKSDAL